MGQMASYKETSSVSQMFWSHIFVIKGTALQSVQRTKYTVYNDSQPLLYNNLFVYLQLSHLRLV